MSVKFYALMLFTAACMSLYSSPVLAQAESHNFITYDTTISIFTPPWGPTNTWLVRISRPANMFTAGNADTASRPAIITMPGEGQQGNSDTSNLTVYGPHYWLNNGWDGSVVLGNGKHYPILITICYVNEVYTNVPDVYNVVDTLLTHYHIKRDAVHFAGLSEGAFTWGSLVAYETTPGAQTGMKIMTSLVALEGTPNPSLVNPNNTLGADTPLYKTWATQYHGKYFYLEGSGGDNFRNGWQYSTAMNDAVPGSAYFSYESDGGGAHCCWNDMYNPAVTNWTCVGTLGTYNAPSQAGTNTMGDYKAPSSIFQWMLRQGDTTLVGSGTTTTPVPPTVSAGSTQSVTLPVSTVTLKGTAVANAGATISSTLWTQNSGPNTATIASPSALSTSVTGLVAGTYTFQLKATDNNNESTTSVDTVHVLAIAPAVTMGADPTIVLPQDSTTLTATDGTDGGPAITSTLWTEVSGPNTATIVSPTALTTSIKNMVAGTYSFRLTVTNTAGLTASASVGITVDPAPAAPTNNTSIPGTITASTYSNAIGVATQATTDVGGGLNVGWIYPGDWMEYNVDVATASTYTVGFRIATPNTGCALQLRTAAGAVLTTVNIPVTGGWQTWQTVTATVTLPAGNQTLQVISSGTALWNFNWMNFEYTTTTTQATGTADLSTAALLVNPVDSMASGINLYPNPAANNVTLTVNNSHTGKMVVQVIDLSGSIKKTYGLSKEGQYTDLSLYTGDLPPGVYFVRMQIGNWKTIQKLLKL